MINKKKINVCVFCGSKQGKSSEYFEKSKKLGYYISKNRWNLVFGGGNQGLMGAIASGFDSTKARIFSVVPTALNERRILIKNSNKKIVVKSLFLRKKKMISLSDIFIVLPGGIGTLDELFEVMALNYLKMTNKKIVILNFNKYWDPLKNLIDNMKTNQFLDKKNETHIYFFNTLDKAIKFIKNNL